MNVTFTDSARADLRGIALHIAEDDFDTAMAFVGEIETACAALAEFPRRFPNVSRTGGNDIRRRVYRDYLVYYSVTETLVTVLRIVHGSREAPPLSR